MEVRLAFDGDITSRVDKGSYFWSWPMVVHLLIGKIYDAKDKEQNKAHLDTWAAEVQGRLPPVPWGRLERIESSEGTAWRLHVRPYRPKAQPQSGGSEAQSRSGVSEAPARPRLSEPPAQSADLKTLPSPSHPVNIPHRGILKRKATESFDLECPEQRECNTQEETKAEEDRLFQGLEAAYGRQERLEEQLQRIQEELTAVQENVSDWQRVYIGFKRQNTEKDKQIQK
ncbi:MAG: hypothetical protein Q9183_005300 [Haloplaca sp. 2 TL-2023]